MGEIPVHMRSESDRNEMLSICRAALFAIALQFGIF